MSTMIYLLYGKDEYRLNHKLREIIDKYSAKYSSSLSFEKIDLLESDEKIFWNYLNQKSLFISKKLLVVESGFSNINFKKSFLKKIKELSRSDDILIFIEKKEIKPTDLFFATLKENGKTQEFFILAGKKLEDWAKNLFTQFGSGITEKALKNLLQYIGNDTWLLSNEIQKLSTFKKEITEEDVDILVRPSIEIEIFKTIEGLVSRNKKQTLTALQRFIDSGESMFYLLSMLAYQMRNLLMVKMGYSGMHPFVFRKSSDIIRNISIEQLKISLQNIFIADLEIKTGLKSPEQAISSCLSF